MTGVTVLPELAEHEVSRAYELPAHAVNVQTAINIRAFDGIKGPPEMRLTAGAGGSDAFARDKLLSALQPVSYMPGQW